ncbi:hypothetical protein PB72LOC_04445 [Pectobacterium atrosepticum]|nr:hypothetical protein PB72LOC_04445 [Pectobacterium atrosepticum]
MNIGGTARNGVSNGINLLLRQGYQRQHLRRDSFSTVGDKVVWRNETGFAPIVLNGISQFDERRRGKYAANVEF